MEASCVRHTEIPGTSRLFVDILYHFDRVSRFYPVCPFDLPAILDAPSPEYPAERRAAMADALRRLNGSHPLVDRFAEDGTVAVVTGQQVGLYGGPAYSIYKALTAVAFARKLTESGRPAVPIFWIATEDHDFAEIDHAWIFDSEYKPARISATSNVQPQQPVAEARILSVNHTDIHRSWAEFRFGKEVAALADRCYQPGRTFGEAFRELMTAILGDHAVLFIDPMAPDVRHVAAPFLAGAARRNGALGDRVRERSQELVEAGYHAQVLFEKKDASLFFRIEDGKRLPLKREDPASLASHAEDLSPNALLRPVMQDYLLPTMVMIGGPAELAYLAQSAVLYEDLLGRQPAAVPRSGFTLVDSKAEKALARYQLRLQDTLLPFEQFRDQVANCLVPPALRDSLHAAGGETKSILARLRASLLAFDPTLAASLDKSRAKIEYQFAKSEAKAAREILRRDQRAASDAARLANLLYPHRHLQERFYSILPFLAEHGSGVIDRIYENIHLDCPDHHVLPIS